MCPGGCIGASTVRLLVGAPRLAAEGPQDYHARRLRCVVSACCRSASPRAAAQPAATSTACGGTTCNVRARVGGWSVAQVALSSRLTATTPPFAPPAAPQLPQKMELRACTALGVGRQRLLGANCDKNGMPQMTTGVVACLEGHHHAEQLLGAAVPIQGDSVGAGRSDGGEQLRVADLRQDQGGGCTTSVTAQQRGQHE